MQLKWVKLIARNAMKRWAKKELFRAVIPSMMFIGAMSAAMKRWRLLELILVIIDKIKDGEYRNGQPLKPVLEWAN